MSKSSAYQSVVGVGAVQGAILYCLHYSHDKQLWPVEWGLGFNVALFLALLMPLVYYWAQDALQRRGMVGLIAAAGTLVTMIVAWQAMTVFPVNDQQAPSLVVLSCWPGLFLFCYMFVPLLTARATAGNSTLLYWDYQKLFELSWRNALISAQAALLTGLLWAILSLGAQLFHLIGIDFPKELLNEPWVAIPLTTVAFSLAYRAGLLRPSFAKATREQWLSITTWLLPLTGIIGVAFTLAAVGGVEDLFDNGLSAFFLLWFAAFWVSFYNSAFQDGQNPPTLPLWIRQALPWFTAALLALVCMAAWSLTIRIGQYGLTPDRVWGSLVIAVALVYAIGYLLPWRRKPEAWMPQIAATNIIAALVMCIGILLLLSPLLDARKLTVDSQLARLADGRVTANKFDEVILGRQGKPGHDALRRLIEQKSQGPDQQLLAQRAERTLEQASRRSHNESVNDDLLKMPLAERLDIFPQGAELPAGLLKALQNDLPQAKDSGHHQHCLRQALPCPLLLIDLNRDGNVEALFWETSHAYSATLYARHGQAWQRVGKLQHSNFSTQETLIDLLEKKEYNSVSSPWDGLTVGEYQYRVFEDQGEPEP